MLKFLYYLRQGNKCEKHGNYYPDTLELQRKIPNFNSDKEYELNNQTAIMHNKFFIFDNKKVWTGSANITSTDLSEYNSNYAVLIENKAIAEIYKQEFEQMFNGNFHKYKQKVFKSKIQLYTSILLAFFIHFL